MAFSSVSVVNSSLLLRTYVKPEIHDNRQLEERGCSSFATGFVELYYSCLFNNPFRFILERGSKSVRSNIVVSDKSCTEMILALGPQIKLDISEGNNALAWVLATIGGSGGGAGTSDESVIHGSAMIRTSTHVFVCVMGR